MNKYCPNKNLPEWKELVEIVGENKAYYLWDQNNGNALDKAPNGNDSKLFSNLLEHYNGDITKAIQAKSKVYSYAFKEWFGDWLTEDKTEVSKVVDENGEPLIVYHGGAKNIEIFRSSSDKDSNTGYGFYTDEKTGEKIPVDSNRTMFFSSNKYVGKSYGILRGIQYMMLLRHKVDSLISTNYGDTAGISKDLFKTIDAFYDTLDDLSEFNPRFSKLKEYLKSIRQRNEKMKPNEVKAFREMLIDVRDQLSKFDEYKMNLAEWDFVLNQSKDILNRYNNDDGIERLISGEIPKELLYEFELYKKIEKQRESQNLDKISNYEEVHQTLSNTSRYYFTYDGQKLRIWDPYYKDKYVTDMTKQELKNFLDNAQLVNENDINDLLNDQGYSSLNERYDLYPTFLNIKDPLIHDYEGTHQGQGYKQSQKYSFGYIAARQVNSAIKSGKDGVIYKNIYDPYLADNYGVFNPNQIKSIDNKGTFSQFDDNIYYKQQNDVIDELSDTYSEDILKEIGEFSNTSEIIDFLLNKNINGATKELLSKLKEHSTQLIIHEGRPKPNAAAWYDGAVNLQSDIISTQSYQQIAEDIAHELLHHYLQKYYDNNKQFAEELKTFQNYYRDKIGTDWYGLGNNDSAIEFLNEFMSNTNFRTRLKIQSVGIFELLKNALLTVINKLFGTDFNTKVTLDDRLVDLQNKILDLLDKVNDGDIDTYNANDGTYRQYNKVSSEYQDEVDKLYSNIQKGLKERLNSIKRYTNKNPKVWNKLTTVIQQLQNSEAEQGIIQFMNHVSDSLGDSIKFLSRPINEINSKQINQLSRDFIGFYKPLVDNIIYLMDTTDIFKDMNNYDELYNNFITISNQISMINNRFNNVKKRKAIQDLQNYLSQNNMPQEFVDNVINWINNPDRDTSIIQLWAGMSSNSSNAVITSIAKILNDTMNQTDRETMEVGVSLVKTLNKAKEKYGDDVQKLLYERLNDGTLSGNKVMPINYGQHHKDKQEFIQKLADKLGIKKDENGMWQIPDDENIQNKWYNSINEFHNSHSNRRFKSEYYTLKNKMLSFKTKQAIEEIDTFIDNITSPITIDGVEYDNLLSESEYRILMDLRKQKALLANPFNLDGSSKTGDALQISKELREFNETVKSHIKYKTDQERFNKIKNKVIAKYGADSEEYKLWYQRNTQKVYTEEFYNRIEKLSHNETSDTEYELREKRRYILRLFRDPVTGTVKADSLSDIEKASILQLDKDIADLRTYEKVDDADGLLDKFSNFAEVVPTDEYYRDANIARENGKFQEWFDANHYEDNRGQMRPASYYTQLKPKDEYIEKYTEIIPINKYSDVDPSSDWYNKDFDPNGQSIQPNKKLYDNSKAYNEMANKSEVKELYDQITDTMLKANSYISFLVNHDDTRMPQIPARYIQVIGRKGILGSIKYSFEEVIQTQSDDLDFVEDYSTMPNGDPIKVIPTRYIKMLDDPNTISTDAVAAVVQYYDMAANYKNMSSKQDDIEMLLNLLKQIQISTKRGIKTAGSTNVYQQAQLLVDRILYGRKVNPIQVEIFGKEINVSKLLNLLRSFITKVNLSGNIWSIATSFFTDTTYTTMESKLGRFFNTKNLRFAIQEFQRQLPSMMENIGNPVPKGKLAYLMMLNQVVKENRELFDRLDQSQVLRSINQNFWYMGYTQSDYVVKSHTLLSVYDNYRFVKGVGFMSENEYINKFYPANRKKGKVMFSQLDTNLYDAYEELPNGDTVLSDKYSKYVTNKLLNDVRNRIEIISKRIDGTLREVDKSAIHANAITAYVVMHKNFMIQGLHDRFKRRHFNLDLGVIEDGYYWVTGKFLKNVIGNRHFALTQLLADYDNMQEYEQYAVKKVLYDMLLIAGSTTVALTMAAIVDGDDDYDNWLFQSITYLALRSAFEFRTMYNPFEFVSMIKSPTAAFSTLENASNIIGLFNPFTYFGGKGPFDIIDRGVYEGMPRILKNVIKVTPFRSIIEAQDPESKRNYLQNQLMSF